jgi:hypothetical protein
LKKALTKMAADSRIIQICPGCGKAVEVGSLVYAAFVQRWNCDECRWKELDKFFKD